MLDLGLRQPVRFADRVYRFVDRLANQLGLSPRETYQIDIGCYYSGRKTWSPHYTGMYRFGFFKKSDTSSYDRLHHLPLSDSARQKIQQMDEVSSLRLDDGLLIIETAPTRNEFGMAMLQRRIVDVVARDIGWLRKSGYDGSFTQYDLPSDF